MSEDIFHVKSISQLHQMGGLEEPTHPLITKINMSTLEAPDRLAGIKIKTSLYCIGLKDKSFGMQYGRNSYDFDEGVLYFIAPNQIQSVSHMKLPDEIKGWTIYFHPDLIRNTDLGRNIDTYKFFAYDVHEALHLSREEQKTVTDIAELIGREISRRIDNHSQQVICSYVELILNLSKRYYSRQFNTRRGKNSDIVSQFQQLMKDYYESGKLRELGMPSIEYFSERIHLSANYLSDLLKKETGASTKEQVNNYIIDKAKTLLLSESAPIREIAFALGFNYPHYFSRLFKRKTGMTPQEYRRMN
ncbi:MAG: helix-turn-helix domain-containing protein [Bacteroidota bacterium]